MGHGVGLLVFDDDDYRIRRGWGVVVFDVRFMYVDEFCKGAEDSCDPFLD